MTGSVDESLEDLAVLALLLDEEEEKNHKQKRIWVHDLWKKEKLKANLLLCMGSYRSQNKIF